MLKIKCYMNLRRRLIPRLARSSRPPQSVLRSCVVRFACERSFFDMRTGVDLFGWLIRKKRARKVGLSSPSGHCPCPVSFLRRSFSARGLGRQALRWGQFMRNKAVPLGRKARGPENQACPAILRRRHSRLVRDGKAKAEGDFDFKVLQATQLDAGEAFAVCRHIAVGTGYH